MSAVLTGTGTVVEKVALRQLPEIHARHLWVMLRTLCASPQWLWGCACLLGGLVCQGLALSLAPISVAQPIFASGIVLLLVLSHFVLHDRLQPVEWFALATIVVALVLLGLSIDTRVDHAGGPGALGVLPPCRHPDLCGRAGRFHGGGPGPQLDAAPQAVAGPAFRRGRRSPLRRGRARAQVSRDLRAALGSHRLGPSPDLGARPVRARRHHGDRPRTVPDRPATLLGGGRVAREHCHVHRPMSLPSGPSCSTSTFPPPPFLWVCASPASRASWSALSRSRLRAG